VLITSYGYGPVHKYLTGVELLYKLKIDIAKRFVVLAPKFSAKNP